MTNNYCHRCKVNFESRSESPTACKLCGSQLWNSPRKNKRGQGRKPKALPLPAEPVLETLIVAETPSLDNPGFSTLEVPEEEIVS